MCEYFILSCSLVGPPFTPIITMVTPQTTFINLVWSQHDGDVVVSYTVSYSFITRGCDGTIRGRNTITGIDGFIRAYNLSNIEENSDINISIIAVNGAGSSPVPASTSSTTLEAGEIFMSNLLCCHLTNIHTHTSCSTLWYCIISKDQYHHTHCYLHVLGACCLCRQEYRNHKTCCDIWSHL